jgi:hypothetical protein
VLTAFGDAYSEVAHNSSADQEIFRILQKPKVHECSAADPYPKPDKTKSVRILFLKIRFNIIPPDLKCGTYNVQFF